MVPPEAADEVLPTRWVKSPQHPDMWVEPERDPRDSGAPMLDEPSLLTEYLRAYRRTLEMKCEDLDADQMARRSVPPSTMSLLGLVRHMADVERYWFRRVMDADHAPAHYSSDAAPEGAWTGAVPEPAVVAEAWETWRGEVANAERYVAAHPDLARLGRTRRGDNLQLREVVLHMIEEYARHCGHADLLRERIDGRVGQ